MLLLLADTGGQALYRKALAAEAAFQPLQAVAYATGAVSQAPENFAYQRTLRRMLIGRYGPYEGTQRFDRAVARTPYAPCFHALSRRDFATLRRLQHDAFNARCATGMLLASGNYLPSDLEAMLEIAAHEPLGLDEIREFAGIFAREGRARVAVDMLQRARAHAQTSSEVFYFTLGLVQIFRTLQRPALATAEDARMSAALLRSNAPYFRLLHTLATVDPLQDERNLALWLQAAADARAHRDFVHCAETLSNLMHAEIDAGRMAVAAAAGPTAVACADSTDANYWRAATRIRYGRALAKAGQIARAERVLQDGLRFAQKTGAPYDIADAWHNLAHAYESVGRYEEARGAVTQFVRYASVLRGDPIHIVSLRDAGIIYWDSGERAAAHAYFTRMEPLVREFKHDAFWVGEYYERIGDLARARTYYRVALQEQGDSARKTAGLARVYLALGALDSAAQMAKLHDRAPLTPEEVLLEPVVEAERGQTALALRRASAWADAQQRQHNRRGAANAYLQVAEIAAAARESTTAIQAASTAADIARRNTFPTELVRALIDVGASSRRSAAQATLTTAVEQARKSGQPALLAEAWGALTDKLLDAGAQGEALAAADSALRARDRTSDNFEDLLDRARFAERIAARLDRGAWQAVRRRDAATLYQWLIRRKLGRAPTQSLATLGARLPQHAAVIDYAITDSGAAALLITRERAQVIAFAITRTQLRNLVQRIRKPVSSEYGQIDFGRARYDAAAAADLYDAIIRPVRAAAPHATDWRVSPDDALHLIPLDALPESRAQDARYLIDAVTVTYIPAAAAHGVDRNVDLRDVTVLASSSPGLQAEIKAIRRAVPAARVIMEPTERMMHAADRSATVLHFTMHAEADAQHPLSSYLKLRAGDGDDGYYHTNEIAADPLHARVVVLSACATVTGRVFSSGPLSLAHAFTSAGADAVVATEWPIGESAARFAAFFYQRLAEGASIPAAVRAAKLAMRADPATADPLQWAPFVVVSGNSF